MAVCRPVVTPIALTSVAHELSLEVSGDILVSGITHDSREVHHGDIYVAIPGFNNHGIEFLQDAMTRGAVAVASDLHGVAIAQNFGLPTITLPHPRRDMALLSGMVFGHPEHELTLIGVTGTNGKTTVASMLRHILRSVGHRVGMIGTLGAFADDEYLAGLRTTPESTDLYATLGYMQQHGITHVVMEVSSHGLELERVAGLQFASAVFTNLSQDHLDFHHSMNDYFAAKAKLFGMTRAAVINSDDEYGQKLITELAASLSVTTCGASGQIRAAAVMSTADGSTVFDIESDQTSAHVTLPMLGDFNVMNALCACASAQQVGVSLQQAAETLNSFPGVPGRCERVMPSGQALAIVDYAHTPDAVEKILQQLRNAASGKLICVLGCGGDRDPSKRFDMGRIAAQLSDVVIVTDDNPRTEDPQTIRTEVLRGTQAGTAKVQEIGDRRAAIEAAVELGGAGDVIAVLGKGHESGQEINGEIFPFDDRDVIRQVSSHA